MDVGLLILVGVVFWLQWLSVLLLLPGISEQLSRSAISCVSLAFAMCSKDANDFLVSAQAYESLSFSERLLFIPLEILLGPVSALPLIFAAWSLSASGRIVDTVRGNQSGDQMSGFLLDRSSLLEGLGGLVVCLMMTEGGIYQLLCRSMPSMEYTSGVSRGLHAITGQGSLPIERFVYLSYQALASAVSLAAPVIVTCLAVDTVLSFGGRFIGQINLNSEFVASKALLGFLIFSVSVWSWDWMMSDLLKVMDGGWTKTVLGN